MPKYVLYTCVQKNHNIAGLMLPFLKKPASKFGSWLVSRNLDFLTVPNKICFLCLDHLYTLWWIVNNYFPSGILEFWYILGLYQSPVKIGKNTFGCCTLLYGNKYIRSYNSSKKVLLQSLLTREKDLCCSDTFTNTFHKKMLCNKTKL